MALRRAELAIFFFAQYHTSSPPEFDYAQWTLESASLHLQQVQAVYLSCSIVDNPSDRAFEVAAMQALTAGIVATTVGIVRPVW